jgi:hypothetical protein
MPIKDLRLMILLKMGHMEKQELTTNSADEHLDTNEVRYLLFRMMEEE